MRELKFRAWDGKKPYEPVSLETMLGITGTAYKLEPKGWTFHKDNIWMQFTGLKDKNGEDIYEGDIVLLGKYKEPKKIEWNGPACAFLIVWLDGYNDFLSTFIDDGIRVIGNIYENPELLTPQSK